METTNQNAQIIEHIRQFAEKNQCFLDIVSIKHQSVVMSLITSDRGNYNVTLSKDLTTIEEAKEFSEWFKLNYLNNDDDLINNICRFISQREKTKVLPGDIKKKSRKREFVEARHLFYVFNNQTRLDIKGSVFIQDRATVRYAIQKQQSDTSFKKLVEEFSQYSQKNRIN